MAFKEGVTDEQVQQFRAFVKTVTDLDAQVDGGLLTPDEAFDKATAAIEKAPILEPEKPKKEEKFEVYDHHDHERTTAQKKK
jgi:hypothetical protein